MSSSAVMGTSAEFMMKMMFVKILSIFTSAEMISGQPHRAICPHPRIEAVEGDGVTLPCYLVPGVDLSAYTSDWKRVDLDSHQVVHGCRGNRHHHDAQMDEYRGRTFLNCPHLSRGNLSLQISSVQPSDSGTYKCFVPNLDANCTINFTVVNKVRPNETERGDFSTTGPPEEPETEPDNRDAAKTELDKKTGVSIAVCVVVAVGLIAAVIFILEKSGKTQIIKKICRGMKWRDAETMTQNYEIENMMIGTPEGDEDPHGADGDGLTDVRVG